MNISFEVSGQPLPKERPRFNAHTRRAHTANRTMAWEEEVGWAARLAMGGGSPWEDNVDVYLHFKRAGRARADLDNLVKAVCDGLNDIVYLDDKQIVYLQAQVEYGAEEPGVHVRVEHA